MSCPRADFLWGESMEKGERATADVFSLSCSLVVKGQIPHSSSPRKKGEKERVILWTTNVAPILDQFSLYPPLD